MLLNCYLAGVVARDWLLIDDILRQDKQVVELHGVLSAVFVRACGTAQGRRSSLHLFDGLLRSLADELRNAVPGRCCAVLPVVGRPALVESARLRSPLQFGAAVPDGREIADTIVTIEEALAEHDGASEQVIHIAARALSRLASLADRLGVVEHFGDVDIGPLQYVVATSTPRPSAGTACAIRPPFHARGHPTH